VSETPPYPSPLPGRSLTAILAELPLHMSDIVRRGARQWPRQVALAEPGGAAIDYRALEAAMAETAATLREHGVRPGDRVMIVNENSIAAVLLFFAAGALDAWPMLVNARLTAREIDAIADHAGARRLFFTATISAEAQGHAARHGAGVLDLPQGCGRVAAGPLRATRTEPVHGDPVRDVAALIYTSGTTGAPKGVMLSHRAALYVASSPGAQRRTAPDDILYCVLPIAHIFGLTSTLLRGLYGGARVELVPRFSAEQVTDALASGGVTVFQGVPQMYARLLEHAKATGRALRAPHLRFATVGGAPIEPELKAAVEAALGLRLVNGYGMTEFASTVSRSLPQHVGRDIAAGPPLPGIETRFVGEDGGDRPPGEPGEIWLRGPNCMLGYYRDPAATRAVLTTDGWYKTGDIGYADPDGTLRIVDRARDVVIVSGFNVYPAEIEAELAAHPAVTLAAVVGRRVAGNEEAIAFVQCAPGALVTAGELHSFLAPRLAPYKRPARIEILAQLPAAPTGKLLKVVLKEMARTLS
jgi:acyl-CoA synthetase (AMP-forming)/AMP-acid ligase II